MDIRQYINNQILKKKKKKLTVSSPLIATSPLLSDTKYINIQVKHRLNVYNSII